MHSPFICRIGFIDFWLYPFENRSVELCSLSIDVDAILFRKSAGNANRSFLARLRRRRTRCHDIDRARVTYCPWRKLCEWPHLRGRITLYMVNEAPYVCLVHMLNRVIAKVADPHRAVFRGTEVSVGRQRSGYLGCSLQWKIISVNYPANCWM